MSKLNILLLITFIILSFLKLPPLTNTKPKVFFTKNISSENIVNLFKYLNIKLEGNVGIKVHSGEVTGKYFLRPSFLSLIQKHVGGTFIESNSAYAYCQPGRNNTEAHMETAKKNGWIGGDWNFQILDENPTNDINIPIQDGKQINKTIVGEHFNEYDSCLILSHFKGHPMGGFGGALKQLSIGFGSTAGKSFIHSGGRTTEPEKKSQNVTQLEFTSSMGDAATAIVRHFRDNKKGIAFINVITNISKVCDCAPGSLQEEPKINDVGIAASLDPVAIDQACLDLIKNGTEKTKGGIKEWFDQVENKNGYNTLEVAEELGAGSRTYELVIVNSAGYWKMKLGLVMLFALLI